MENSYLPVPSGDLPASMPSPFDLAKTLEHSLTQHVAKIRAERGSVTLPSDVFELVRSLAKSYEVLKDYENAFAKARKIVQEELESELCEAVGDQDGVPNGGLTVPDADGDVRITVDSPNTYSFDLDQLIQVVITAGCAQEWLESDEGKRACSYALSCINLLLTLGDFRPQVSKVKAAAMELSRAGNDDLAGVLSSVVTKKTSYRGVKMERKG